VRADTLAHVISDDPRIIQVGNPLPAQGGSEREPVEDARLYAPTAFQTQERCVTAADYAALALRYPQVLDSAAQVRWTGSWYTAFVYVQRSAARAADEPFRARLARFLEGFRLAGHALEVRLPYFVPLEVALDVTLKPGYDSNRVEGALNEVFSSGLRADGTPGFFYSDHFGFNRPLYLSQVIAAAMTVPGVAEVDVRTFRRLDEPRPAELPAVIAIQELEIARLDNDPADPERGSIRFNMKGGL
jgi:predicted phage baseplate assembly protein